MSQAYFCLSFCLRRAFRAIRSGVGGPLLWLVFAGVAFGQHSVTLTWTDTANPAGTQYNVYRLVGSCPGLHPPITDFVKLTGTPVAAFTYQDLNVLPATTYCYVATSVSGSTESLPSNDVGATVPVTPPVVGKPTIVQEAPVLTQIEVKVPGNGSPE